jgi:hypothetical protein
LKTTAKKEIKKEPPPFLIVKPATVPKLEGSSCLKTTVKKEMNKVPPLPPVLMKTIVPKRGFSFSRQFGVGKRKKVDLQLGNPYSGQNAVKPIRDDAVDDMR